MKQVLRDGRDQSVGGFIKGNDLMLWTIVIVLILMWVLGFGLGGGVFGSMIHVLLIGALLASVFGVVRERRT